jgi:O-antigen/teichoic acid export membrane protein
MMTYAVIILLAGVVPTVAQLIYFTRLVGLSWQFDRNLSIQLFRGGIPFFLWSVSLVIYGTIDVTLLSLMTRDEVVGWYGTAYRFIGVSVFLPFALTMALFPSLSSATGDEFKALARRSLDAVILTSLPVALFLAIGASAIISFFRWGDDFQHAVVPLQILAIHVPMVSVSMVAATVLLAKNREGARTRMAMVAGVLNTLANLALIPFFTHYNDNGAIGAAIVTVFTEVFMMTGTIYLIGPGVFARANLVTCVRCMAAGAVMSGAMVLVRPYGMLPIMVAGGLTYPVAALAFGATNFAELRELLALIRARGAKTGSVDPEAAA